ncbi:MAG: hypothetical protein MMC33_004561 [Icmadophila ericetorum]|nr:hypothetical protein [Icmadophila ericetorum]
MAREFISSTNFAPLVEIFIWLGLTTSILTVFVRIGIKWKVIRKIGYDDYLIVSSLLFATGQSIAISTATANGLGTSISSLSEAEIAIQLKASDFDEK